jgi:CLIP-associating protein 1/2
MHVQVPDLDALVNVLKATLRTSNLHLTNAALSALPVILPAIISRPAAQNVANHPPTSSTSSLAVANNLDVGTLRLALAAFLPPGGVIDRLGEKEKAQVKAREILVSLGGYAFRASPTGSTPALKASKGHEPPIAIFEKFMKEGGLASKVWKVREQVCLMSQHVHPQY